MEAELRDDLLEEAGWDSVFWRLLLGSPGDADAFLGVCWAVLEAALRFLEGGMEMGRRRDRE